MIPLLGVGALGAGILGAGASFWGNLQQAGLLREAANLQRQTTDEEVRRFEAQKNQTIGTATAIGAASGVEFQSGSLQKYLSDMAEEFRKQTDWMKAAGYEKAANLERSADIATVAAPFKLFGDVGASLFRFGESQNWWQKKGL